MIRVAVIGAGNHSEVNHGPSLRDYASDHLGEIVLAAVCDLDNVVAAAYAEKFGFARVYNSYHTMLDKEVVDALIAITPVHATRRIVGELLRYRIPLLLEKPPGRNSGEADELLRIAESEGTPTMVSFNRRFVPAVRIASEYVENLEAGRKPRLIIARMLRHARTEIDFVIGTAIHLVDTVLSFMGKPESISAHHFAEPGTPTPDGAACEARLEFPFARSALLAIEPAAGADEESYELIGRGYTIRIETERNAVTIHDAGKTIVDWRGEADEPMHTLSGCRNETEAFLRAVAGKGDFTPSLAEAHTSLAVAETISRGNI